MRKLIVVILLLTAAIAIAGCSSQGHAGKPPTTREKPAATRTTEHAPAAPAAHRTGTSAAPAAATESKGTESKEAEHKAKTHETGATGGPEAPAPVAPAPSPEKK